MSRTGSLPGDRAPFRLLLRAQRGAEAASLNDPGTGAEGASSATEALATFREALQRDPTDADYHYMLGETLLRLGRRAEALPALEEAARRDPQNATYHDVLGCALWEAERYAEAGVAFAEAVRLDPAQKGSRDGLAATLAQLGRPKEALAALHQALRVDGSDARLYNNLGVVLWELNKQAEGLRAFRRAAQQSPESASIRRNLAQACVLAGDGETAVRLFRDVLRQRPDDVLARLDLADTLFTLGRHPQAEEEYDEALRRDGSCIGERPQSREARDTLLMERLRREMRAEAGGGRGADPIWDWLASMAPPLRRFGSGATGIVSLLASLVLLALALHAAWVILPPYVSHYLLRDKLDEVARAPISDEAAVLALALHAAAERGLGDRIGPEQMQITTGPLLRAIACEYDETVTLLPGVHPRLHFSIRVEEPYFATRDPEPKE